MSSFDARIRLPGKARLPLNVVIDVSDDRIRLIKDDRSLGDWPFDEVKVDFRPDAIYLCVEEEEIALSLTDADGFASALRSVHRREVSQATQADASSTSPRSGKGVSARLRQIDPEEQIEEIKQRIARLSEDLADDSISPSEVFRRWLRLLKEINVRHGQGSMPTPLFYRLNTELLDLIPAPNGEPSPVLQTVGTGPRL